MDITFISDTHGLHGRLILNPGTVLIHVGDVTEYGSEDEVADFLYWFSRQPFANKIIIAGNHDLFLESCTPAKRKKLIPSDIIYLQNSGIEIAGMKVWGSPVTPYFLGRAFNARQEEEKWFWNNIPDDLDILDYAWTAQRNLGWWNRKRRIASESEESKTQSSLFRSCAWAKWN